MAHAREEPPGPPDAAGRGAEAEELARDVGHLVPLVADGDVEGRQDEIAPCDLAQVQVQEQHVVVRDHHHGLLGADLGLGGEALLAEAALVALAVLARDRKALPEPR